MNPLAWLFGRWLAERLERRFPAYKRLNRYGFPIIVGLIIALVLAVIIWSSLS